ncbi:MAG: polysaccharide biosynthesis C-terminal domain-containing protein [Bacteroidota bacterium]
MGIIKKQGLQAATYSSIGVVIGFLVNAILMPKLLSTEQVGLLSFLGSLTSIFSGLFTFGLSLVILSIFPKYGNKNLNSLYTFILMVSILGIISAICTYYAGNNWVLSILKDTRSHATSYAYFSVGFVIICSFRIIFKNNDSLIRMMKNTVLGTVLESLVIKVIILASLIYYYFSADQPFEIVFILFVFAMSFPGIFSQFYLWAKGIRISSIRRSLIDIAPFKRQILSLAGYGVLNAFGVRIIMEVDRIMVSGSLGLDSNGVYSIAFLFGAFVNLPANGVRRISSVLISNAWNENKMDTISDIYKKSCINLSAVGFYLLLGVWLNLDTVFSFLPEEYSQGKYVMLLIGFSHLVDMTFGVNNEILATSKLYRYTTYFMGVLIILVVVLNAIFIPIYGINGAALASLIALVIVNIARYILLWKQYKFQPFNWKLAAIWVVGGLFFFLPVIIPGLQNAYLQIMVTSIMLTIGYWSIMYFSKISTDINSLINDNLKKLFGR